ncbi:MAG: crossover junction endodeoxyribonuclease RuvC, partial [Actinomycetota bacterium]
AGWGAAGKGEIQRMVQIRLGLTSVPKPADAADAVALALCHLAISPFSNRVATAIGRREAR